MTRNPRHLRAMHGTILAVISDSEATWPQIIARSTLHWPDAPTKTMLDSLNGLIEIGAVEACVPGLDGMTKYRLTGLGRGRA